MTDLYNNKLLDVDQSDINELIEQVTEENEPDLIYIEQYREEIGSVVLEALNEHVDKFFVDLNKHLKEHHRIAIRRIVSDNQDFLDARYLGRMASDR